MQAQGGILTAADVVAANATVEPALAARVGNYTLYFPPPPSSAAVVAFAMKFLAGEWLGLGRRREAASRGRHAAVASVRRGRAAVQTCVVRGPGGLLLRAAGYPDVGSANDNIELHQHRLVRRWSCVCLRAEVPWTGGGEGVGAGAHSCACPPFVTHSPTNRHLLQVEAMKHGFAARTSLGDPLFPPGPAADNITAVVNALLNDSFVDQAGSTRAQHPIRPAGRRLGRSCPCRRPPLPNK